MNRYREIKMRYDRVLEQMKELDLEYEGKKRGDVYSKRKRQLIDKADDLVKKAKNIGVLGNICHIHGVRSRPHRRNQQLMVDERFNLYFVNISEEEASALVHLHVKNVVHYTVKFFRPGIIITTS